MIIGLLKERSRRVRVGEADVRMEAEVRETSEMAAQSALETEQTRNAGYSRRGSWGQQVNGPTLTPSEEMQPCQHLDERTSGPRIITGNACCFRKLNLW